MYFSALHGHGTSASPSSSGAPTVCRQGTNAPSSPIASSARLAHAGHDPHRDRDVRRVGQLDADVATCPSRAGPSRTGRRTSCGRASRRRTGRGASPRIVGRVLPVVRRPGVLLALGADERAVLDAGDVGGVRPAEVAVRALGVAQACVNVPPSTSSWQSRSYSSAEPSHQYTRVGLGELGDLIDPGDELAFFVGTVTSDTTATASCCG